MFSFHPFSISHVCCFSGFFFTIDPNSLSTSTPPLLVYHFSLLLQVAARTLKDTVDQFMEEGNPSIAVAKKISYQMHQMSQFARGKGELQVLDTTCIMSLSLFSFLVLSISLVPQSHSISLLSFILSILSLSFSSIMIISYIYRVSLK